MPASKGDSPIAESTSQHARSFGGRSVATGKVVSLVICAIVGMCCGALLACRRPVPKVESHHLFFRNVRVNGHHDIVGLVPLPAESAKSGECYEFAYYGDRLRRVSHLLDGRLAGNSYFGDSVAEVTVSGGGAHSQWFYDGVHRSTVRNDNGVHAIGLSYSTDGRRLVECSYRRGASYQEGLVVDLDVALDSLGVAACLWQLDSAGNRVTCVFGNDVGWRVANRDSVWSLRYRYDAYGRLQEERYFGRDGKLCEQSSSGIAMVAYAYNPDGLVTEERHLGANERLKANSCTGAAAMRWQYDDRGLMVARRCLDTLLKPTPERHTGVAAFEWKYDAHCRLVEEKRLGPDGLLCEDSTGTAVWRREYDEKGNILDVCFLDRDGRLVERGQHCAARIGYVYDSAGNVIEERFFGRDGMPKPSAEHGAAVLRMDYDANGKLLEKRYHDTRGNLSDSNTLGVARIRFEVPVRDGKEIRYYGRDGRLKEIKGLGFAIVHWTKSHDEDGHSDMSYYGADSCLTETDDLGVATVRHFRDTVMPGLGVTTRFLDKNGNVLW